MTDAGVWVVRTYSREDEIVVANATAPDGRRSVSVGAATLAEALAKLERASVARGLYEVSIVAPLGLGDASTVRAGDVVARLTLAADDEHQAEMAAVASFGFDTDAAIYDFMVRKIGDAP
jgi:hypothetical protein